MIKFEEAVSESGKIEPTVMSKKEMKIYKKMDKYVTKCINKAIKSGFRYAVVSSFDVEYKSVYSWEYESYEYMLDRMLSDYKKELIKEGYKIEKSGIEFKISWEHGMNKDV